MGSTINAAPAAGPVTIFGRAAELGQLRKRVTARHSFLLHGPVGVGKSLLLSAVCEQVSDVLYSDENPAPHVLYRNLAEALLRVGNRILAESCPCGPASVASKTAVALKGLVRDALHDSSYLVVLDHLVRPSQALAAAIRELMLYCAVPVIAVSRSPHMEDAGFALSFFPDRTERLGLRNFDSETSRRFAAWAVERERLTAQNLSEFLVKIVEYSQGNPGTMLQMVRMATSSRYNHAGHIKIAPLYIDQKLRALNH